MASAVAVGALGCGAASVPAADATAALTDPPAAAGAMAPNLASGRDGSALLTWLEPSGDGHRLRFSRFDRGAWSPPTTIAEGPGIVANWADVPSSAETDGGIVVAHWAEAPRPGGHSYGVMLARSIDGGATWKRLGPAHDDRTETEHGFVTLLPDKDKVRAVWLDGRATESDGPMALRTALVGETVEAGELIDPRVCDCCSTSAASAAGGLIVAYRDRSDDEVRDISILGRQDDATWSAPRTVHEDGWRIAGCPVNGPVIAAEGNHVAVAWYTYAGRRHSVRVAFSADGGASFAPAIEVDGPVGQRAPLGRVGLALDRGEALVSWLASRRDDAAILVRRVAPDGRVGPERRIAATRAERRSGVPRLTKIEGERVMFAWTELGEASRVRAVVLPGNAIGPVGDSGARALAPAEASGPSPGEPAPTYGALSLDGRRADLARLRGKVVLLNVWATWCVPCRQELVDLAELHRQLAGAGLAIVAVSVDARENREQVASFARGRGLPFAVWLDHEDAASKIFGVRSLPTTFVIGRDGAIRWRRDGVIPRGDPELRRILDAALSGH